MGDQVVPRDDRAWPRSSAPASVVLILGAVAAGVGLVVGAAGRGALGMVVVGGAFVVAFGFGMTVALLGMRRWIAGHPVPGRIQALEWGAMALGFVLLGFIDPGLGWAFIAGLMGGLLAANLWGIRTARANRALVDQAIAAQAVAAQAAAAPVARSVRTADTTRNQPLTAILRNNLALERRRAIAWLIAGAAAVVGAAFDLPSAITLTAFVIAACAFFWVLRRLAATWLAFRNFTSATTPPRRAYVVLLNDPAPRMLRPLLAIWSEPPALHDGRMPKPEQVYRCDEEQDALLSFPGHAIVHEAWLGTGRWPRSKPRWVAADAGVALPHRRAVFGQWYVGNLLSGERPEAPEPLTLAPPHPSQELITRHDAPPGNLVTAVLGRLAGLGACGLLVHWLT